MPRRLAYWELASGGDPLHRATLAKRLARSAARVGARAGIGAAVGLTGLVCLAGLAELTVATPAAAAGAAEGGAPERRRLAQASDPGEGSGPVARRGWRRVEPGGPTGCADGSPYAFFVRQGDPKRLLVHLQGGGACWSARTCDPEGRPTYDFSVTARDDPSAGARGLLALDEPRNPFAGWTAVFVPYCSGDVHLGDARRRYPLVAGARAQPRFVEVDHRGRANAGAALVWAATHSDPERVFVAGESAGAIASPFWAAQAAERFPEAQIAQLGDAAGGYRARALPDLLETWGAAGAIGEMLALPASPESGRGSAAESGAGGESVPAAGPASDTKSALGFEPLYVGAGLRHPRLALARLDRAEDLVQRFFLNQVGVAGRPLPALLAANLADIRAHVPRVRQYLAPGERHTTLSSPAFYTLEVGGRSLRDWVADHAAGREVDDVICAGCALP